MDGEPLLGRCYELSFLAQQSMPNWTLCHGFPVWRGEGADGLKRFGHAWLESPGSDGNIVVDPGGPLACRRAQYYATGDIEPQHVRRYTAAEALAHEERTGRLGGWEPDPYPGVMYDDGGSECQS